MSQAVLTTIDARVATLTINRPEKRNALNGAVIEGLISSLDALASDPEVGAIVLTGAGERAFSSGGDLSGMSDVGMLGMHQQRERFIDLFQAMIRVGKPIIARVNGDAFAGGLGLMLACDLVVAVDSARFGTPEIKVGLFPMMIMALIFRNVGRKKGMEMLLTGDRFDAPEAEKMGLINYAVPREALDDRVDALAKKMAGFSPAVLKLGRDAFYQSQDMTFDQALQFLRSQLTINTLTEDAAEGVMSFLMKKSPEWKGR